MYFKLVFACFKMYFEAESSESRLDCVYYLPQRQQTSDNGFYFNSTDKNPNLIENLGNIIEQFFVKNI